MTSQTDHAVCPFCRLSMAVQSVRPESTEHLMKAAHELILAGRSFLDGLGEMLTAMEHRSQEARGATIQKIDVRRKA